MTDLTISAAARRPVRSSSTIVWLRRLAFFVGLLVVWEAMARLGLWPSYIFPVPTSVFRSLAQGFRDGSFLLAIRGSLGRLLQGYFISIVVGLSLGLVMARIQWLKDTLGLVVMGLQALPSICWLPLALLWFGLSPTAILFVVIMGSVLSIAQATEDGVRNTPPIYLRAARNLGARGWQSYAFVILPSALPTILTGMKLGWAFAWRSLMAGELLYTLPGLGALLTMGRELNDMSRVVAVMLVIIALGLLTDQVLFGQAERRVRERWGLLAR